MLFKRKVHAEKAPLCFHEWRVADMNVVEYYTGIDVDWAHQYVLGCEKCGSSKTVDEIVYATMKREGFIKELAE